ncbi:fungal-specific transcription factor domain-containing protein [Halenospora varia]|nr:fungal-specific transcription factor domain-containing protein [Halenospora varia]
MDAKYGISEREPETSWSPTTTPGSDHIEDVVRQTPIRPPISIISGCHQVGQPVGRRLRIEERRGSGATKVFETFEFSMMDSRASMDGSDVSSSSALTMITSATSSCTDPWSSSGGFVEDEEDEGANWNEEEDFIVVPKLEPLDDVDMTDLTDVKENIVPKSPESGTNTTATKRPRGRPRKHPKPTPESTAKVAKGRSKTGCITCRKRKKKCDEAKPGCMNCKKNAVECEGYPPTTRWKSGKEKAEEARLRRAGTFSLPKISLPPMINGVETEGDRMFFQHYITRLSLIFTCEGEQESAFKHMLLPIALHHEGLMHSILALSSKHIDYRSDYGRNFLQQHPGMDVKTLEERSQFHHDQAVMELVRQEKEGDSNIVTAATYGQILCLVLQTLSDSNPNGQHRFHLQHYQRLIKESPPEDGDFLKFIHEFFQYHICADELIALPQFGTRLLASDEWELPNTVLQPSSVCLLGISDSLFLYMSKITTIRNKIRENMERGIDPVVDYTSLYRAAEIDAGIREWTPAWPEGDSRDLAGLLYKQMMWVYLWRTIYPAKTTNWKPDPRITQAVDDGLLLLNAFGPRDPSQTLILAPAFVIGCAAFEPAQRDPIRKAIGTVKAYMEYKNSDTALEVLEEVWRLMDAKDEKSWDWQRIAHDMGMDFLAT